MIKTDNILIKKEDSLYCGSSPDPFTSPAYIPGKRDIGVLKFDENEESNQDDDDEDIIDEKHKLMHHQKNFWKSYNLMRITFSKVLLNAKSNINKKYLENISVPTKNKFFRTL